MTVPTRRGRAYVRLVKALRRWRSKLLGLGGCAIEAEEWPGGIKFHNGVDDDGKPLPPMWLRACPVCAAYVQDENREYHVKWHIGGSV